MHLHIITSSQALKDSGVHIDMAVETDVKNLRSMATGLLKGDMEKVVLREIWRRLS